MENERMELVQRLERIEKAIELQRQEMDEIRRQLMLPPQPMAPPPVNAQMMQQTPLPVNAQMMQQTPPPVNAQMMQQTPPQPMAPPPVNPADYGLPPGYGNYAGTKDRSNMENRIGRSMGVVASILVFISIILFVTLVYSSLTDAMKVICIFGFSFIMLAAGMWAMHRRMDIFTMSLTGCGMGAVFLSLFITHVYFEMLGRIPLYLLILLWAVLVYLIFAKKSYAFELIGQAGITIAVFFGAYGLGEMERASQEWWSQYIFLLIFFVVISLFYILAGKGRGVTKLIPLVLMDFVAASVLQEELPAYTERISAMLPTISVIAAIIIIYHIALLFIYVIRAEKNNSNTGLSAFYVIFSVKCTASALSLISDYTMNAGQSAAFVLEAAVLAAVLAAEIIRRRTDIIHIIMCVVLYVMLIGRTQKFDALMDIIGIGIYIFPLLAAGHYFRDRIALVLAYATLIVFAVSGCEYLTITVVVSLMAAGLSGYLLYHDKNTYHSRLKCIWYVAVLWALGWCLYPVLERLDVPSAVCRAWVYMLTASINAAAVHVGLASDWSGRGSDDEKNIHVICGIINIFFMICGINMLDNPYHTVIRILILIVTAAVFFNNIRRLYRLYGNKSWSGIYTGIKLSIFVCAALRAYELSGPYVSLGWLVLSIILIMAGFKWQYTYLRLYGLFLSMFAVVKLIVFDIDYEIPAIRVLSFLLSGILCFAINLIYNKCAKK